MKMLLYCTKAKPSLMKYETIDGYYTDTDPVLDKRALLNGKIVGECDFEVEEIRYVEYADEWGYETNTLNEDDLIDKSCLSGEQLFNYLKHCKNGAYAIHIKNLHIFDKPKELGYTHLTRAPQNMCYGWTLDNEYLLPDPCIVVSVRPEWICKILNGEKTIEVRKKVLKEMLK